MEKANACPHLLIRGLIAELPPAGTTWPVEDRERWLRAMESAVRLLYPEREGEQSVGTYGGNTTFHPEKLNA